VRSGATTIIAIALCLPNEPLPAFADGLPLGRLFGYSFAADWSIDETETCSCSKSDRPYVSTKHFTEKIYVSDRGRLFHSRSKINDARAYSFSMITDKPTQELIYEPGVGFVSRVIPSDYDQDKTTFARIAMIAVAKNGDSMSCSVSTKLILKSGEKDYIFYAIGSGGKRNVYQISSFDMTQSTCTVSKGNIFSQ
jgi:hypothetical protein